MRRIDFLGANGIGKSTVYARLLERRTSGGPRWYTLIEAKRKVATDRFLEHRTLKSLAKFGTCFLPRVGDLFAEVYTIRSAENAFAEGGECYQAFFEYCIEHLMRAARGKSGAPRIHRRAQGHTFRAEGARRHPLRVPDPMLTPPARPEASSEVSPTQYLSLSRIFGRLKELCFLESIDETVIFDESLTHTVMGLLADTPSDRSVRAHFEEIPLPDAVVYMTTTEDEVLRRIGLKQAKKGPIVRHRGLDEKQLRRQARRTLRIAAIGASTLQWRGAEVLHLDATSPPEDNAERIEAFVAG